MLDKDQIKNLKHYTRTSQDYSKILAAKYGISRRIARSIIIHGWRRMLTLMRGGKNEFHIDNFGHIYPRKEQTKLLKLKKQPIMEKDNDFIAICSTKNDANTVGEWSECTQCHTPVWLSASTLNIIQKQNPQLSKEEASALIKPHCFVHGLVYMQKEKAKGETISIVSVSQEQKAEIKKALKNKP